jgi:predicted kinase
VKVLYIVRGLSGSGKTTLAHTLTHNVFSADDYFTTHAGDYNFNPSELGDAHEDCQFNVEEAMSVGEVESIAVANTFSQTWEAKPYFELAEKYSYSPFVVECQNAFKNVHEVPQETIESMRGRWEQL